MKTVQLEKYAKSKSEVFQILLAVLWKYCSSAVCWIFVQNQSFCPGFCLLVNPFNDTGSSFMTWPLTYIVNQENQATQGVYSICKRSRWSNLLHWKKRYCGNQMKTIDCMCGFSWFIAFNSQNFRWVSGIWLSRSFLKTFLFLFFSPPFAFAGRAVQVNDRTRPLSEIRVLWLKAKTWIKPRTGREGHNVRPLHSLQCCSRTHWAQSLRWFHKQNCLINKQ